jgi:hypothetical protein
LSDGFVFAAIAPHGDLVLGDDPPAGATRAALEELGRAPRSPRPLGRGWHADFLFYEAPTYYGMLCAAFDPTK